MKKIGFIVFIAALALGSIASLGTNIGKINFFGKIRGSGNTKIEKRDFSGFNRIEVSNAINVSVTSQKDFAVLVNADDNLLQYVVTEIKGNVLKIYTKERIKPTARINVNITMPELNGLEVSGASTANIDNIKGDSLEIWASGASKINASGQITKLKADASGASSIDAEDLTAESIEAFASGASKTFVSPVKELDADASGASSIYYANEPQDLRQNASGASSVLKMYQ